MDNKTRLLGRETQEGEGMQEYDDDEVETVDMEIMIQAVEAVKTDLGNRRTFIGGSDAPAIIGVSPWKSRVQLWREKTGRDPEDNLDAIERVMAGKLMEDTIARLYTWKYGTRLRRINERVEMNDPSFPAVAQIDRKIEGERKIVEIKNVDFSQRNKWGEDGSSEIPVYYYAQIQHQMMCANYEEAEAVPLFGGNTLGRYPITQDVQFIESLYEAEREFWKLVQEDKPPEPMSYDEASLIWDNPKEEKVSAEAIASHLTGFIQALKDNQKQQKREEGLAKLLLVRMMENLGDTLMVDGKPVCTWKMQTTKKFDVTSFKEAHPDLVPMYTKETTSRVFRLSKAGKETIPDFAVVRVALDSIQGIEIEEDQDE